MPELSDASALTVTIVCTVAGVIAFVAGVAVTALLRRLAARRNLQVGRRPIWRAPFTVLLVVLAVRGVLVGAKLIAAVTAVDGDAIAPLCREVRVGLLTFLQQNYPAALPAASGTARG
ncbi:MAG: hypothetical protein ACLP5E_02675 [Streptosporangiaceae bacterium]